MTRHCTTGFGFAPLSVAYHRRQPRICTSVKPTVVSSAGDASFTFSPISRRTNDSGTDLRNSSESKSPWRWVFNLTSGDARESKVTEEVGPAQKAERRLIPAVVRRELIHLEDVFIEALIRRAQYATNSAPQDACEGDFDDTPAETVHSYFEHILPVLCRSGKHTNAKAAEADVACLRALQRTVRLGAAMADAKLNSRRATYATLMKESKREALFNLLHYEEEEQALLDRVAQKARCMDINSAGGDSTSAYLVAPKVVAGIYKDCIIPLVNQAIAQSIASRWVRQRVPPSSW